MVGNFRVRVSSSFSRGSFSSPLIPATCPPPTDAAKKGASSERCAQQLAQCARKAACFRGGGGLTSIGVELLFTTSSDAAGRRKHVLHSLHERSVLLTQCKQLLSFGHLLFLRRHELRHQLIDLFLDPLLHTKSGQRNDNLRVMVAAMARLQYGTQSQ